MDTNGGPRRARSPWLARLASVALVRLLPGGLLTLAALLLLPATAEAHALVVRSDPPAGSSLAQVPKAVTVTFSEAPEPHLSTLSVRDGSGRTVSNGPTAPVPGNALQLTVPLSPLLNGVYTVRWKTVSRDDGHASAGSFTFGVGPSAYAASTGPAPALASPPTAATPLVVAGHWIFYVGLGLLVGGAWVSLFALGGSGRRLLLLTLFGALAMIAGLVVYGVAQALADGTPIPDLLSTSLGLGLAAQALPGLLAAACVEVALLRGGRVRTPALAAATALGAVTILVHVLTTHAASSHSALLQVLVQWAHLAAFATWIGGLGALLIAVGSRPAPAKSAAVRRFSQVAAASLAVVGLTGVLRALDEVAAWDALVGTLFGQLVLAKVALLVTLAGLGGWNRFRSVPAVERSLRGLRRVGRLEIGVAGLALVASAILTSLVPPALVQVAAKQPAPPRVVARASAPAAPGGTAIRGSLEVSPGYPGQNRFTLRAYEGTSSRVVSGTVVLRFEMPSRPELAGTTLALARAADGSYQALGDNLTLIGDWRVTALLVRGTASVGLPFELTCNPTPQDLQHMTMGGVPMVYGVRLGNGWRLQAYLTPGHPGRNTLHLAFTDQRGGPVPVADTPSVTATHGGARRTLQVLRLALGTPTANQFYAAGPFTAGRWDFHVAAAGNDGSRIDTTFSLNVAK